MENDRMPYNKFVRDISSIRDFSDSINDGWHLMGHSAIEGGLYLKKKSIIQKPNSSPTDTEPNTNSYIYDYHVVYSMSYGVPVLCFNILSLDGKRLPLQEAWELFNPIYSHVNMYSVLTQSDHPVLKQPFLTLHPCKTVELLSSIHEKSQNLVVSWLSLVSPAANLPFNQEFEKLSRPDLIGVEPEQDAKTNPELDEFAPGTEYVGDPKAVPGSETLPE